MAVTATEGGVVAEECVLQNMVIRLVRDLTISREEVLQPFFTLEGVLQIHFRGQYIGILKTLPR